MTYPFTNQYLDQADSSGGFCLMNNVAIAAKYAVKTHGLDRVLILDWDVHHGNGTQHMFYDNPKVLYISLHRLVGNLFDSCQCSDIIIRQI